MSKKWNFYLSHCTINHEAPTKYWIELFHFIITSKMCKKRIHTDLRKDKNKTRVYQFHFVWTFLCLICCIFKYKDHSLLSTACLSPSRNERYWWPLLLLYCHLWFVAASESEHARSQNPRYSSSELSHILNSGKYYQKYFEKIILHSKLLYLVQI